MKPIKQDIPIVVNYPNYDLSRQDKQYWLSKLEEIKQSFKHCSIDRINLSMFEFKLHEWQTHVNNIFNVKDTTPITISTKLSRIDGSQQVFVLMNEELRKLFS